MRLDRALVERGLARSRGQARELIASGRVRIGDLVLTRAAAQIGPLDDVTAAADHYVSRAAHKLLGALADLDLDLRPAGRALDAGSSTGGFTQVLLESGCSQVIAVDVGTDQLAAALRTDPRVTVHEQTNLRELCLDHVGGVAVDLVVADVSFISLTMLLDRLVGVLDPGGRLLLMIKPQFEVGRQRLESGGVVRTMELRRAAVASVVTAAEPLGWWAQAGVVSRVPGPAGNREYFVWFARRPPTRPYEVAVTVPD